MHGTEPDAIPAIAETWIDVAQQKLSLDFFRPGSDASELFPAWFILEQIERATGTDDGVIDHHWRNEIFEIPVRSSH